MSAEKKQMLQVFGVIIFIAGLHIFQVLHKVLVDWADATYRVPESMILGSVLSIVVIMGTIALDLPLFWETYANGKRIYFSGDIFCIYAIPGFIGLLIPFVLPLIRSVFLYQLIYILGWDYGLCGIMVGIGFIKSIKPCINKEDDIVKNCGRQHL